MELVNYCNFCWFSQKVSLTFISGTFLVALGRSFVPMLKCGSCRCSSSRCNLWISWSTSLDFFVQNIGRLWEQVQIEGFCWSWRRTCSADDAEMSFEDTFPATALCVWHLFLIPLSSSLTSQYLVVWQDESSSPWWVLWGSCMYLSIYISIYLPTYLSIYPSIHPSYLILSYLIYLSIYLSVYISHREIYRTSVNQWNIKN